MENIKKIEVNYPFLTRPAVIYERENGHKIVFAYKEGGLVNVSTWVKTGSINEDDKISGISHFLEHVMFKGTKTRKVGEFDKIMESRGGIVNAATWKDYTFYYVTLPKGPENQYFYDAIDLHADMMLNAVLPSEELGETFDVNNDKSTSKRERHVVIEEIRMREDQPWSKVYNATNALMYDKHPYKRDVIGTAEIIASTPQEVVYDYYKTWYSPKNMTTVVVGEFDFDEILPRVLKAFDYKDYKETSQRVYPIDEIKEQKYTELKAEINTSFLMFGYLGAMAKDLKNCIGLDLLSIILGEGQSSRFYQNLIEKAEKPIFNYISTDHYHFRDGSNFFVQANFQPEYKEKAIELVKAEIQQILDNNVSENELKKAKKKLKIRFAENAETVSEIAETIGSYMTVENDLTLIENYVDILDKFNLQDLYEIAKNYLDLNKVVIAVLTPNKDI